MKVLLSKAHYFHPSSMDNSPNVGYSVTFLREDLKSPPSMIFQKSQPPYK